MKYTFVDGSGNRFTLENLSLSYEPMTPKLSSSGNYSGGRPYTIDLDKSHLIRLIDVCERVFWARSDHSEKRTMGSGTLIKNVNDSRQMIYIRKDSASMSEMMDVFGGFSAQN